MLLSSGLSTAPCGAPLSGVHSDASVQDARLQKRFDQRQHAAVGDLFLQARQQTIVRNRVEIAFQIGVHDMHVAGLQQLIDSPQRVFATSSRAKSVAVFCEVTLEDRFDDVHNRRLHDPISHRRNAQRSRLRGARLGNVNASNRLRAVRVRLQRVRQLPEYFRNLSPEFVHCHMIHARSPPLRRDLLKRTQTGFVRKRPYQTAETIFLLPLP